MDIIKTGAAFFVFYFRTIGASVWYNVSKGQKVNVKQHKSLEELDRT